MTTETGEYVGRAYLELLREAHNYNAYLADLVHAWRNGASEALDFGAGSGTPAQLVRKRGLRVCCVEPDAMYADILRGLGFETVRDMATLPPASISYIYSLNVLEHIEDDAGTIARLGALLRPGGRLLLYVPAYQVLYSSMDRDSGHVRRYRRGPLVAMCKAQGLRVEHAAYVDSLGFFAALAYRAIDRGDGRVSPRAVRLLDRYIFPCSRVLDSVCRPFFGKNLLVVARRAR